MTMDSAPAATPDDDEGVLLARVRDGDRTAFDAIVRRHGPSIVRLATRWTRDADEAADLAQRAFLQAFLRVDGFRGDAELRTWLFRIAINLCKNYVRDRARLRPLADDPPIVTRVEERIDALRRLVRLEAAIGRLPPRQRAVVDLRVYEDLPFCEIARLLASNIVAVKVNFHYAMKRLRKEVSDEDG